MATRSKKPSDPTVRRLLRARDRMRDDYATDLRLELLAKTSGLSPFHFQRSFQAVFGRTPHAYLTEIRLERAKERLARETQEPMIRKLSHATVYVLDQDSAKAFYTEKLGFELRNDVSMGGFRWLTVSPKTQPDVEIVLMPIRAGMTLDEAGAEQLRALVKSGCLGGGVLETADCQKTYDELTAKGVVFTSPPAERPYGIEAILRDDSGNFFSLTQRR